MRLSDDRTTSTYTLTNVSIKLGEGSGESSMASDMQDDDKLMDEVELAKMDRAARTFEETEAGKSFDNNSLPSVEDGLGFSMDEAKFMDNIARSPRKKSSQRKHAKGDTAGGESSRSGREKTGGEAEDGATGAGSSRTATATNATKAGAATLAAQDLATAATPTAMTTGSSRGGNGKGGKVRRGSNSPKAVGLYVVCGMKRKEKGRKLIPTTSL